MTINVLWIILACTIGLGTDQAIESSTTTAEASTDGFHRAVDECYINGVWYNPCTTDPAPNQPPPDAPPDPNPQ